MTTAEVLEAVLDERMAQNRKWGEQNHEDSVWALILGEELGEVCEAALDGGSIVKNTAYSARRLRKELLDVAAVAVGWIEAIDRRTYS